VNKHWAALVDRYHALSLRERAMVALAVLALSGFLVFSLALAPQLESRARLATQIAQQEQDLAALRAKVQEIAEQARNPDAAVTAQLAEVRRQVARIDDKFKAIEHKLVPPDKVASLLQAMLERSHGLRLVALRTLPPSGLIEPAAAAAQEPKVSPDKAPPAGIYKHAVEITVEGGYRELLAYLAQLERSPQQLFWNRASLRADYPSSTLTLVVFTLSTERTWLAV
jgi:MSHA biogenesis protein MshJ